MDLKIDVMEKSANGRHRRVYRSSPYRCPMMKLAPMQTLSPAACGLQPAC